MNSNSRLVYSTSGDNLCGECRKVLSKCRCENQASRPPATDGIIRISRETKGRKGKGVTLISGFDFDEKALKAMAKKLKALCGSGGTVKAGIIEIQGDHRAALKEALESDYTVKLAGG